MLHDVVEDPGARSEEELLAAHADQLAAVVDAVGLERAADAADLDPGTLAAVAAGDREAAAALDLEAVAAVLALSDGAPPAEALLVEAREALLFGMTAGVLNVDVVAAEASVDVEPREVQGMLEGRHPTTLGEFVALQRVVEGRSPEP